MDCRSFLLNDKVFQKLDCHPQLTIFPKMDCRASSSTTIFSRLDCHLWQSFPAWIVVLLLCLSSFSKFGLSYIRRLVGKFSEIGLSYTQFPMAKVSQRIVVGLYSSKISAKVPQRGLSFISVSGKFSRSGLSVDSFFANVPRRGLSIVAIFS